MGGDCMLDADNTAVNIDQPLCYLDEDHWLPEKLDADACKVGAGVLQGHLQPTFTESMESEPPSIPSTGKLSSSDSSCIPRM